MDIKYENKGKNITVSDFYGLQNIVHFHSHIEIVYLLCGKSIAYSDFKANELTSGDLFITFPNQIHYYNDIEPTRGILLILPQDFFSEYTGIIGTKVPVNSVIKEKQCNYQIKALIEQVYLNHFCDNSYTEDIIKGYAIALMGEILRRIELAEGTGMNTNDALHNILDYCNKNYDDCDICLQSVSDNLHISKFYISHLFSNKIKMSFNDYINEIRINKACKLLENKKNIIADVAYDVGFGSIRSFNRAFKKHRGDTPRSIKMLYE